MSIYACSRLKAFFIEGIHSDIPEDAETISADLHRELLDGQTDGHAIDFSSSPPTLIDRLKVSNTSNERAWRTFELQSTEWLMTRHRDEQDMGRENTLTEGRFTELLAYRQSLRDWPVSPVFPDSTQRPAPPLWLATQTQ
ncbi:phage tail protein [Pseudomonas caricapapayae]|uniref:Phage tail protein n=1 Tax=Pseudomonas caricapapayae TaxID=46678 RepID=A0ACC7LQL3_9PSED